MYIVFFKITYLGQSNISTVWKYFCFYRVHLPDTTSFFNRLILQILSPRGLILTLHIKGTWRPSVELVGAAPTVPAPLGATYTKTSLALKPQVRHLKEECQKIKTLQINFSSQRPQSHVSNTQGDCHKFKALLNNLFSYGTGYWNKRRVFTIFFYYATGDTFKGRMCHEIYRFNENLSTFRLPPKNTGMSSTIQQQR